MSNTVLWFIHATIATVFIFIIYKMLGFELTVLMTFARISADIAMLEFKQRGTT